VWYSLTYIFSLDEINDGTQATVSPTFPRNFKRYCIKETLTTTNTNYIKLYLITTSTEAVTLEIPVGFNLILLLEKEYL
jgi:hypothetical protein